MKAKKIEIKIDSLGGTGKRFAQAYKKIKSGKRIRKKNILSFENIDLLRKLLTNERLRIIHTIKRKKPQTIYALAKELKRPYANTFNDVKLLSELGLVGLEKNASIEPSVNYSEIKIAVKV